MLVLLTFLLAINAAFSWNTCNEEAFCNKIRNQKEYPTFSLDTSSISSDGKVFKGTLGDGNGVFSLVISAIDSGIFRITIDDPSNPRQGVPQALDGEPKQVDIQVDASNPNDISISSGDNNVLRLNSSPFKISAYKDGNLVVSVNDRGKMVVTPVQEEHAVAMDFTFPTATSAYGIPLHAESLQLQTTETADKSPYRLYNVDHCCYTNFIQDSLYGAEPVLYAHSVNSTAAVFWLNAAQTFVDIKKGDGGVKSYFISESGLVDIFILTGPTFKRTVAQYVNLTGTAPLPQLFALGYHQSRWSYATQEQAEEVVQKMDEGDFPFDAIWFDIDYMDGKRSFTWNYTAFPDPVAMQNYVKSTGRKVVLILDPHFKVEDGYFVWDEAAPNGYFVKYDNGSVFEGQGWPDVSAWYDFLNPQAAEHYSTFYSMDKFANTTDIVYVWNDMNEPEVFNGFERSWTRSLVYHNEGKIANTDVHNIYGFSQVRATYKGYVDRNNNKKRPFILSRSHFSGSQRYATVWTGDNNSTWAHLQINFPMCLSLAISGLSFCGADIGGFAGNLTHELYQRWYQAGAWMPFYRAHTNQYYEKREPYLYPEEIQVRIRNALRQRYYHLPMWYTLFYEHELYGEPVIRPMVYEYPSDPNTHSMDDQWMVGGDVLVHPVSQEGVSSVKVYLPGGENQLWYDKDQPKPLKGTGYVDVDVTIDSVPVYYKGGSVLVTREVDRLSSVGTEKDPYTIYMFTDSNGEASGTLYFDDYESFEYRENRFNYFQFHANDTSLTISLKNPNAIYPGTGFAIAKMMIYHRDGQITKMGGENGRLFAHINPEDLMVQPYVKLLA